MAAVHMQSSSGSSSSSTGSNISRVQQQWVDWLHELLGLCYLWALLVA